MKKLTINMLHLVNQPEGQGVASATKEQIKLLKESTQDVFEITENKREDGDINHFHQIDPMLYLRIKNSNAISVMHVHFLPETLQGSIKVPKPIMELFKLYFLDYYKSADYLVVVNPIFIEPLTSFGITADRIKYIPNYVSKDDFYKQDDETILATKQKYNIDPNKFVVLGVGQVQTRKGVLDFIEVANQCPELQFVWAGGFSFGAITDGYKELKEVVENPPSNVIFTDIIPRDQMNSIFNIANCLFMPSYNELFPMAILEACNVHIPMLLRDLDLYHDILFDKYVVGNSNEEFIGQLKELSKREELFNTASNYSKELSEYYSKENVSSQWVEFYQSIYQTHQQSHKLTLNSKDYDAIKNGEKTAIIDSSLLNPFPLHEVIENDRIIFKKVGAFSSDKLIVKAKSVVHHQKTTLDEALDIIAPYQTALLIDDAEMKKHAQRAYFSIIEFSDLNIYEDSLMIDQTSTSTHLPEL